MTWEQKKIKPTLRCFEMNKKSHRLLETLLRTVSGDGGLCGKAPVKKIPKPSSIAFSLSSILFISSFVKRYDIVFKMKTSRLVDCSVVKWDLL